MQLSCKIRNEDPPTENRGRVAQAFLQPEGAGAAAEPDANTSEIKNLTGQPDFPSAKHLLPANPLTKHVTHTLQDFPQ